MKLGIVGNGFVGKATKIFACPMIDVISYDILPAMCDPLGTTLRDICQCDLIFLSVPTPMNSDGSCYTTILSSILDAMRPLVDIKQKHILIRSTVPPGTSEALDCYFMPEFLTEKNFENDFKQNKEWIFGLKQAEQDTDFKKKITELIHTAHSYNRIENNTIRFVTTKEAEMIKLFRNNFLSVKVAFCNEIAQFCSLKGIDYETVRRIATADSRIGPSHTNVPGHDGKRGFGGTCFPKDAHNVCYEMKNIGMKSYILAAALQRNEEVDRPEKDWHAAKGRSVL